MVLPAVEPGGLKAALPQPRNETVPSLGANGKRLVEHVGAELDLDLQGLLIR